MSSTIYLHFYLNLGNYIDSLKRIATVRNELSTIGYQDWFSWNNGDLKSEYVEKYANQLKGLTLQQAQFTLSTTKLSSAQKEQVLVEAGLLASKDKIKASLVESTLAQVVDNEEKRKQILIELGLYDRKKKNSF
ncbi:MAG: hypothetical protein UEU90_07235 [Lachnospiraceae bacterium]|mgnify:CR=1 FL=1|nr:hypothetical protein [Lachnospiraceae bacterium]